MQIIVTQYFSEATGVSDDLVGKNLGSHVLDMDDTFGVIGCIMSAISQCHDVRITYWPDDDEV